MKLLDSNQIRQPRDVCIFEIKEKYIIIQYDKIIAKSTTALTDFHYFCKVIPKTNHRMKKNLTYLVLYAVCNSNISANDEETWVRAPFNYNLHIDYNDRINTNKHENQQLDEI